MLHLIFDIIKMSLSKLWDSGVLLTEWWRNKRSLWNVTFSELFQCGQAEGGTVQDKSADIDGWRGCM